MDRKWKKTAALGLTVLLGCMTPMSTMLAAENEADSDVFYSDENISDEGNVSNDESLSDEGNTSDDVNFSDEGSLLDDENLSDEGNTSDDESFSNEGNISDDENLSNEGNTSDDENLSDEGNIPSGETDADAMAASVDLNAVETVNVSETMDASDASETVDAPEIMITRGGRSVTQSLGGEISFEYVNNWGPLFEVSVSGQDVSLFFCLDKVKDTKAGAREEAEMGSLAWGKISTLPSSIEPSRDDNYVLYVKAEADGKTYYARSGGVVVDTNKPVINGVEEGKTYAEGTAFQVEDANLESVFVNEQPVSSEDGSYKVKANGTSCVIRAKDKAGNETTCSITVFGSETPGTETPETGMVISKNGVYELKAGVKYHLAEGKWKVDGDKSVYRGDSDFYVAADGSYKFTK